MDTLIGEVPDAWSARRLEDCCEVQSGPSGSVLTRSENVTGGVPVVKAGDVGPDGIALDPSASIGPATAERLRKYRLESGDIVLVRIGQTSRHALATDEHRGWLLGSSCIRVRVLRDVLPAYLSCYLTHPAVKEWLAGNTNRGVLPTVNTSKIGSLPLVLPPLAVQESVVEVAKLIDAKIRAHRKVVEATGMLRDLLLPRLIAGVPMALTPSCDDSIENQRHLEA
ncbi:restriction endonuclease subunit S [Asanoa sp. NPDC049518]|uniref:restriction endonuclease subunit S n=1 Tax=unclassified Asanoa TaxID=2685164 RepID=UPI0034135C69